MSEYRKYKKGLKISVVKAMFVIMLFLLSSLFGVALTLFNFYLLFKGEYSGALLIINIACLIVSWVTVRRLNK